MRLGRAPDEDTPSRAGGRAPRSPGALAACDENRCSSTSRNASGTFNATVRDAAVTRMAHAGAQIVNWFSVACELHRDWRNDIEGLGDLLSTYIPSYRNLMTSYFALAK